MPTRSGCDEIDHKRQIAVRERLGMFDLLPAQPFDQPGGRGAMDAGDATTARPCAPRKRGGQIFERPDRAASVSTRDGCGNSSAAGDSNQPSLIRVLPISTATRGNACGLAMQRFLEEDHAAAVLKD